MKHQRSFLALILFLYILLGFIYATTTPPFEASDELWHYPLVRHLADGNPLPIQVFDPAQAGPWKQEASQPPLYYYLGAAFTFWIDTSDMDLVRLENPHVDNGLITEDGNINLVVHNPENNPWEGTLLAVKIVRFVSVLLGAITVYLTYRIGHEVDRSRPEIALGAAAVIAFIPMFLFISGAVNNDNLAIMLATWALFLMVRRVASFQNSKQNNLGDGNNKQLLQSVTDWLLIGVVIGAALLTKEGTIGLLPLAWGTAFTVSWLEDRKTSKISTNAGRKRFINLLKIFAKSVLYLTLVLLPVLLIAGWWYYRNIVLYGDWLGWNAFIAVLGQRGHPASFQQLWGERRGFLMAFWGLFGGVNVPMPLWIYTILNSLLVLSVLGFMAFFIQKVKEWLSYTKGAWDSFMVIFDNLMVFISQNFSWVASFLLATAVVVGLIQWATTTWSSQGRLVFTALAPLVILFVIGLVGWMPKRAAKYAVSGVAGFLFLISLAAPFLWISPAYQPESYLTPSKGEMEPLNLSFGDFIRLNGISIGPYANNQTDLTPGDSLWVYLDWEILRPTEKNWSVFVHLVDPVLEQPIAQRDMYLGQGLLLTSWLEPGHQITNSYHIQIPETAVSPAHLEVVAGLYDFNTGDRLATDSLNSAPIIEKVMLGSTEGLTPNSIAVNFEDQLQLVGYEIDPRRTIPGDKIELTLYWRAMKPLNLDYSFFAQIVDEDTTRWASHDFMPPEGTSAWAPDDLQKMSLVLTLEDDTPSGLYPIVVGVYTQPADGEFDRLQIKTADGRLTDDFLNLTQVRID